MIAHVVLVSGVDYPKFNDDPRGTSFPLSNGQRGSTANKPFNWRKCCMRLAELARRKYGKDVRITLFDFELGTREDFIDKDGKLSRASQTFLGALNWGNYRIVDGQKGLFRLLQPSWPKTPKKETPPPHIVYVPGVNKISTGDATFSDYEDEWRKVINGQSSRLSEVSISIIHVYDFIRQIGAPTKPQSGNSEGKVKELHFLSHAFRGGPVLVNTNDIREALKVSPPGSHDWFLRDPFDKDGRADKDFHQANFTAEQLGNFRAAFADDGFAFQWGCDATFFWKELIRQTVKLQDRGASTFQFSFTKCWGDEELFQDTLTKNNKPLAVSIADIEQLIRGEMAKTYSQMLANAIGKPVIGALPGTASDPDRRAPADKILWHVAIGENGDSTEDNDCFHPSNLKKWLTFYKKQLSIKFDQSYLFDSARFKSEFARGFVRFEPAQTK